MTLAASGLVGGLVLRLDQEARGQSTASPKFIHYNHANGLQNFHLNRTVVNSPTDFQLNSFMTTFEPFKDELTVVQNLACNTGTFLHGNASCALSCVDRPGSLAATGVSFTTGGVPPAVTGATIDQMIAAHLGEQAGDQYRLRSLALGHPVLLHPLNCTQGTILGRGEGDLVFPTMDPVQAHEFVFGVGGQDEVLRGLEKSYLDYIKDDVAGFSATLPQAERPKLEQYLESVREIERALVGIQGACASDVAGDFEFQDDVDSDVSYDHDDFTDFEGKMVHNAPFWKYMCDLGIAALQCGVTPQVSLLHSFGCSHFLYTIDGKVLDHHRDVTHEFEEESQMEWILNLQAESVAYVYNQLKQIPEGAGTMADSVLLQWMSDGGGYHHHGYKSHPVIYLGGASGKVKTGQWLRFTEGEYSLACAHLGAARAMGLELETFGDGIDPCDGPLPGFLA